MSAAQVRKTLLRSTVSRGTNACRVAGVVRASQAPRHGEKACHQSSRHQTVPTLGGLTLAADVEKHLQGPPPCLLARVGRSPKLESGFCVSSTDIGKVLGGQSTRPVLFMVHTVHSGSSNVNCGSPGLPFGSTPMAPSVDDEATPRRHALCVGSDQSSWWPSTSPDLQETRCPTESRTARNSLCGAMLSTSF